MVDAALHTGIEHPSLVWVLASSVLAFVLGLGIGSYSETVREWLSTPDETSAE